MSRLSYYKEHSIHLRIVRLAGILLLLLLFLLLLLILLLLLLLLLLTLYLKLEKIT